MEKSLNALEQVQSEVISQAVVFGPKLLVAAIIMVAGYYVGNWLGRFVERGLARLDLDLSLSHLIVKIVRLLVLVLFLVIALQNLGIQLLPLIAGLGVAGAGVALAMQGILSSMVAGFVIIFTHPFRIGEYISIVGVEGTVEDITLFNTILSHTDASRVVIPNRKIVGEILHNFGHIRQVDISVNVGYDADLNGVFGTVQEILCANRHVLQEPAPVIQVQTLDRASVTIGVKPWVAVPDYVDAVGEINKQILEVFREREIVIPFPRSDVRIISA